MGNSHSDPQPKCQDPTQSDAYKALQQQLQQHKCQDPTQSDAYKALQQQLKDPQQKCQDPKQSDAYKALQQQLQQQQCPDPKQSDAYKALQQQMEKQTDAFKALQQQSVPMLSSMSSPPDSCAKDLFSLQNIQSAESCSIHCAAEKDCSSSQFKPNKDGGLCWLKSGCTGGKIGEAPAPSSDIEYSVWYTKNA